jgi:DNA helicase HerA-like ATPase
MIVGQIVGGNNKNLVLREKKGVGLEMGDLVAIDDIERRYIYMVSALEYGSLISEERLFDSSGTILENIKPNVEIPDKDLRLFRKVTINPLIEVRKVAVGVEKGVSVKSIPTFLSKVRGIQKEDFSFLDRPKTPIFFGRIRSGSKVLDMDYLLDGEKVISHHALISAQTGRGKSNLVKVMLWESMKHENLGILVFDVHNEYFGVANTKGLKDHPQASRCLSYFSKDPPPGQKKLVANLKSIVPEDLVGVVSTTEAQEGAMQFFYNKHRKDWIREIMTEDEEMEAILEKKGIQTATIRALRRKLRNVFGIIYGESNGLPTCSGDVFDMETRGETTVKDMADLMEQGRVVLIDGSSIPDDAGLIITGAVMRTLFMRYEGYRDQGSLGAKPQVGVVLEEAPRVLDEARAGNIFGRIAREGRKFKIGLIAVTQMVSVIPTEILANIGTKVIMGSELAMERKRLIESASQDLTAYDQLIAGLDKGEAIISSIFSKFPVPIQVPLFEEVAKGGIEGKKVQQTYF